MPTAPSFAGRIFDQAFNKGNLAIIDELISAEAKTHAVGWDVPANRFGLKQVVVTLRGAFPDLDCAINDEIVAGERLAARWTLCGTHKGSLFGNPPTGRSVEVQAFIFARIADGQIVEAWILVDQMSMLQQLGIVPPPRVSP